MVERYVRDVEAAGSNPVTSTTSVMLDTICAFGCVPEAFFVPVFKKYKIDEQAHRRLFWQIYFKNKEKR